LLGHATFDIRRVAFDNPRVFPRLLTLLQFTRIALVFTAVGDGWAAMLLHRRATGEPITPGYAAAVTVASIALYTFGMTLNDLIDRRRDSQLAPGRPLPSGRISVATARAVCIGLAVLALAAGGAMVAIKPHQWHSLPVLALTLGLIAFYDFAGKYLVAPGLLTLGLVRGVHAAIAAPDLTIPWHPIVLLTHVTILSTVCYHLEGKRPRLTLRHWLAVLSGLLAAVAIFVAEPLSRLPEGLRWVDALWVRPPLFYAAAAAVTFTAFAVTLRLRHRDPRQAGRQIMLYGLLWLIVYDAGFVGGYVGRWPALIVLSLLPLALLSVQAMRAWSKLVELSQRPQYQRAR
jgi:4-hydroxybenzoate polyprenyltransferase